MQVFLGKFQIIDCEMQYLYYYLFIIIQITFINPAQRLNTIRHFVFPFSTADSFDLFIRL